MEVKGSSPAIDKLTTVIDRRVIWINQGHVPLIVTRQIAHDVDILSSTGNRFEQAGVKLDNLLNSLEIIDRFAVCRVQSISNNSNVGNQIDPRLQFFTDIEGRGWNERSLGILPCRRF